MVQRLKTSGAIILGKLNLHEFALGCTGDVRTLDPAYIRGRSIELPGDSRPARAPRSSPISATRRWAPILVAASGFLLRGVESWASRPTTGLVSIRGIIPCAASLDHCGPMARRVEDVAMMLNEMTGFDNLDIFSVDHPREKLYEGSGPAGIGLLPGRPGGVLRSPRA